MAKPASLYSGYQRVFFPRLLLDASVSARGRQIFGRRPVDLGSRRSQFKDLSETGNRAWKISGTHGRKRYKDVKKITAWIREFKGAFDWPYSRQEPERLLQLAEYVSFVQKNIWQKLIYPIQGRYSRFCLSGNLQFGSRTEDQIRFLHVLGLWLVYSCQL